jgi:hypothetical protein
LFTGSFSHDFGRELQAAHSEARDAGHDGDKGDATAHDAYLLPCGFLEEEVTSLEVDKQPVSEAAPGKRAGHKTSAGKAEVPVGTRVFKTKGR